MSTSASRRQEPTNVAADDTKDRVLAAAGPIFAERGFRDATVREICSAAGVNIAAVNYHFGDKERLYIESVKRAHRLRMEQVPIPEWPPGTPAAAKLQAFVNVFLRRVLAGDESDWTLQLMLREMAGPTAACQELVRDYIRPHFEMLLGILNELVPADMPAPVRHRLAFTVVGQCLHYRVAQPIVKLLISADEYRTYDADLLAEHITRVTLGAVGAAPPLGSPAAGDSP